MGKPPKHGKPTPPPPVPIAYPPFSGALDLDAPGWRTTPATYPHVLTSVGAGLHARIGETNETRLGYVYQPINCQLDAAQTLRLAYEVRVTGSPVFHWDDSQVIPEGQAVQPPSLCLMFGAEPLPFTNNDEGRWFAMAQHILVPGAGIALIPLDPYYWKSALTGTRGDYMESKFLAALSHLSALAFVLGGGFFAGHGVYVTGGTAEIVVTKFSVE